MVASIPPAALGAAKALIIDTSIFATILTFGDSFATYSGMHGLQFAGLANITGIEIRGASINFPSGGMLMEWDATARTISITAPGGVKGPAFPVKDGVFTIQASNPAHTLRIGITTRALSAQNKSDTVNSTQYYNRKNIGSYVGIVEALSNLGIRSLPDLGIGGNRSSDVLLRIGQVLATRSDIYMLNVGTNDVVQGVDPATIAANIAQIAKRFQKQGKRLIVNLISPRFGTFSSNGAATSDQSFNLALHHAAMRANYLIDVALRSMQGVSVLNCIDELIDQTTGSARRYITSDGLHPAAPMALIFARSILDIVESKIVRSRKFGAVAANSYFSAANPNGNLLPTNQGALAGSGGTLGAGCSLTPPWVAGTAYATGAHVISCGNLYRATVSYVTTALTAPFTQSNFTDGGIVWEFLGSGMLLPWVSGAAHAVGDTVVTSAGRYYLCVVAGTSSTVEPTHITGTGADGGVTWHFQNSGFSHGFAAGWTAQRIVGSALTCQLHKVTDGKRIWQEAVISGAVGEERTGGAEEVRIYPSAATQNKTTGDIIEARTQMQILDGAGCYGVYATCILTGSPTATWDNHCLRGNYDGFGDVTKPFTIALDQIVWQSWTAAQLWITIQAKGRAKSFRVRFGSVILSKVA